MTPREFGRLHGFTKAQAVDLASRGLIEGATLNPYSKRWDIPEGARLADWLQALPLPVEPSSPVGTAREPQRAARSARAGAMTEGNAGPNPRLGLLAELEAFPVSQQTPQGCAEGFLAEVEPPAAGEDGDADAVLVYRKPEVQATCLCLRRAVARQSRQHQSLWLDAVELVQVFEAVDALRRKAKSAAGKGLQGVGPLKATDGLWRKLQEAMQRAHVLVDLASNRTPRKPRRRRLEWVPE
jgi:hypothetical protein